MPRPTPVKFVFLNVPYDQAFENLYLAYIVGLTQLGLEIHVGCSVPNQDRLNKIIDLIEKSDVSVLDLSRTELSRGVPRFNMPVELGLALYRWHVTGGQHRVFIFESKRNRAQRSTSDINRIDPQIHNGTPKGVMSGLRNLFRQPGDVTTVPEMLSSYRAVKRQLPDLRRNAGGQSLYEVAVFQDLRVAALVESQKLIAKRKVT